MHYSTSTAFNNPRSFFQFPSSAFLQYGSQAPVSVIDGLPLSFPLESMLLNQNILNQNREFIIEQPSFLQNQGLIMAFNQQLAPTNIQIINQIDNLQCKLPLDFSYFNMNPQYTSVQSNTTIQQIPQLELKSQQEKTPEILPFDYPLKKSSTFSTIHPINSMNEKLPQRFDDQDSFSTLEKNDSFNFGSSLNCQKFNSSKKRACPFKNFTNSSSSIIVQSRVGDMDELIDQKSEKGSEQNKVQSNSNISQDQKHKLINNFGKGLQTNLKPESKKLKVNNSPSQLSTTLQTNSQKSLNNGNGKSFFLISNYKKKLIANLELEDQEILQQMRHCKKFNFSKNVIKQFYKVVQTQIGYLYEIQNPSIQVEGQQNQSYIKNSNPLAADQNELRSKLQEYLSTNSFTHALIKKIMMHPLFSLYFRDFLEYFSSEWIEAGKTKYKHEQTVMISFLKLCLRNEKLLIFLSEHDPNKPSKRRV